MMIIFAAALSISSDDKTNTVAHKMETETSNADESSTEKDTHIATVGEYIEGETWKISLLDAKEQEQIEAEYYSDKPDEDDYFNYFYLESYLDSYSTDIKITMNKPEGYDMLSGDVAAGKK